MTKVFYRHLSQHNRNEPAQVRTSGYVKGGAARMVAGGGLAVRAYPVQQQPEPNSYDFATDIPPRENYLSLIHI